MCSPPTPEWGGLSGETLRGKSYACIFFRCFDLPMTRFTDDSIGRGLIFFFLIPPPS